MRTSLRDWTLTKWPLKIDPTAIALAWIRHRMWSKCVSSVFVKHSPLEREDVNFLRWHGGQSTPSPFSEHMSAEFLPTACSKLLDADAPSPQRVAELTLPSV
jgi:hypothetical protein